MGQEIQRLAQSMGLGKIICGVDTNSHQASLPVKNTIDQINAQDIDVVIDFSSPELFGKVVQWCAKHKKPLVSGTTGIQENHKKMLAAAAQSVGIAWAPNMSLGIATLRKALAVFSQIKEFDFQIEEFHHNKKKDNPSGTALLLQNSLQEAVGRGLPAPIGIRGGGIFGTHKVWAMSDEEVLMFEHQALNRGVFAKGALIVAQQIVAKGPGSYGIDDFI